MCADTLDFYAEHGEPLDVDNDTSGWPILLLIVIGVPMIIAGIVCGVLYSQMKTARLKTEANDYIGAGLKLRVQVDNYTHTDRVQRSTTRPTRRAAAPAAPLWTATALAAPPAARSERPFLQQ